MSQSLILQSSERPQSQSSSTLCLEMCGVDKTYTGGNRALSNINLTLSKGMFGLLGPNGAGKSTLMRSLATLQAIDNGQIRYNGKSLADNPTALRQQLGYLPQSFGVYPRTSAITLLNYIAVLKGIVQKRQRQYQIDYLLERTNLTAHKNEAVADYSGGMRQRFGIAQALLGDPKVLIVDEPTAGLDPRECHSLHNLLCEVAEKAIVLYSTHIVEDIQNLCSQMAVLIGGQLQFIGQPNQLVNRLNNKIYSKTVSQSELPAIKSAHSVLSTRLIAGEHQIRVVEDDRPSKGFNPVQPDLTDAYFYLLNAANNSRKEVQ